MAAIGHCWQDTLVSYLFSESSSSWCLKSTRSRPLGRWMMSSSPAPVCSLRVWSSGKCWQATHLLLQLCEGVIFVEHALWFVLLDHRGRLVRVPASVCGAYDCSVCYVRCEASPEWLAASGTAGFLSEMGSSLSWNISFFFFPKTAPHCCDPGIDFFLCSVFEVCGLSEVSELCHLFNFFLDQLVYLHCLQGLSCTLSFPCVFLGQLSSKQDRNTSTSSSAFPSYISGVHHSSSSSVFPSYTSGVHHSSSSSAFPSYTSGVHHFSSSSVFPSYFSAVHHSSSSSAFPSYISGVHPSSSSAFPSYISGVHHSSSPAFPSYISGVHHFELDFCACDRFLIQPLR